MGDSPEVKRARSSAPELAFEAVLKRSEDLPVAEKVEVRGNA